MTWAPFFSYTHTPRSAPGPPSGSASIFTGPKLDFHRPSARVASIGWDGGGASSPYEAGVVGARFELDELDARAAAAAAATTKSRKAVPVRVMIRTYHAVPQAVANAWLTMYFAAFCDSFTGS